MEIKKIWQSKTFWTNLLMAAVVPFLPAELKNPEYVVYAITAVNVILRLVSKGKVELM
jgi:hypothetical protein